MRKFLIAAIACVAVAGTAAAELQNVLVDGQLRIRGNYYTGDYLNNNGATEIRWPAGFLPFRPFGAGINAAGVVSPFGWDERGTEFDNVEMRTRIGVEADFTNDVIAYLELDSYDIWGQDFRSAYITGADFAAASVDDVEVYQAFVEARDMWGYPLRLRIGRQEMSFGSEWLVGVNDTNSAFTGLSFDAVRATYATDMFSVDAWASQLFEGGPVEADEDIWFYGVYGSYLGLEDIAIDAYWMLVRDAVSLNDTNAFWLTEWIENALGVDNYDPTYLHTIGLRGAGTVGALDFDAEVAYQFGDADSVGFLFPGLPNVYGDDDADFDNLGANLEVGYTFDMAWQPRVFLGGAWFEGEENRDLTFGEWVVANVWPFRKPDASVSFNRLFSNWEYSQFLDINGNLSNLWLVRGGVGATPTERLNVMLTATYFQADEPFDAPRHVKLGGFRIPVAPGLSFWTTENDDSLGTEVELSGTYHYTEDLSFKAGWAHLFVDDGLNDGNFNQLNGLGFNGGRGDEDADYLYLETRLAF